jgi:hypothetical protein
VKKKTVSDAVRRFYRCLSVRQPWAYAILHMLKDRENRSWKHPTKYRGPLLIHASAACTRREFEDAIDFMAERGLLRVGASHVVDYSATMPPSFDDLKLGGIVGRVSFDEVVEHSGDGHAWSTHRRCINCGVSRYTYEGTFECHSPNGWQMDSKVGLVLKQPEPTAFVPWKGNLGLFHVDAETYDAALAEAVARAHVVAQP